MPISFRFAVQPSLRAPVQQLCTKDELSGLSALKKGGWDPSRGELGKAVAGGISTIPLPAETDKTMLFVLEKSTDMRGATSGVVSVLTVMLDSWFYRLTLIRPVASGATTKKTNWHTETAWTLEGIKQLRPQVGQEILKQGKAAAEKAAAPRPIQDSIEFADNIPADQLDHLRNSQGEIYQ